MPDYFPMISIRNNGVTIDIDYEIYPSGEPYITTLIPVDELVESEDGTIEVFAFRLNCDALMVLAQVASCINGIKGLRTSAGKSTKSALTLPYVPGCRQDKFDMKVKHNQVAYLQITTTIINAMNFDAVVVGALHSEWTSILLNNLVEAEPFDLSNFVFNNDFKKDDSILIIAPDKGAKQLAHTTLVHLNDIGYDNVHISTLDKTRDPINHILVEHDELTSTAKALISTSKRILVVDDMCDGGNTLNSVAAMIRPEMELDGKLYMVVHNGIFSRNGAVKNFDDWHAEWLWEYPQ